MAAPTPVSSLVHSSTLVTAGVYLLIRFFDGLGEDLKIFLFVLSCLTIFMSGVGANFEYDLKKIIALSTLSQLGLIISVLFLGGVKIAFFHLLAHALFKALLFMCAGNIIHIIGGFQDIRFIGGLVYKIPLTCALFNIRNLSLCGFPFLSGFYSKDLVLEFSSFGGMNIFIIILFYVSVGLTVSYSFRLVYYLMVGDYNYRGLILRGDLFGNISMSMLILGFIVVFSGSLLRWLVFSYPIFLCLRFDLKIFSLLMILLGLVFGLEFTYFNYLYLSKSILLYELSFFLSSMWNLPFLRT